MALTSVSDGRISDQADQHGSRELRLVGLDSWLQITAFKREESTIVLACRKSVDRLSSSVPAVRSTDDKIKARRRTQRSSGTLRAAPRGNRGH